MNTAPLTGCPEPSWIITGQAGPTRLGRPRESLTASGAVLTRDT
jgi:hypothetical protein